MSATQYVGYAGNGVFTQSGGTNTAAGNSNLYVGYNSGASGAYNLSGSGLIALSTLSVGHSGSGTFMQSGGTNATNAIFLGYAPGGNGAYGLSGNGVLAVALETVGYAGSATFTQSGGTNTVGSLALAASAGAVGVYNLNGGLLAFSGFTTGPGSAAMNLNGGTLQAGTSFSTSGAMVLNSSGNNATIDTQGNTLTLAGPIAGPGGLVKIGTGTLVLNAGNTYSGPTAINAGTLEATSTASLPAIFSTPSNVRVAGGATLAISVGGSGQWIAGNLDMLLSTTGLFSSGANLGLDTSSGSFAYGFNIAGSGLGVVKLGSNTLVLSGSNTYGGGTTIDGGVLELANSAALGSGTVTLRTSGMLDLDGYSPTILGLAGDGTGVVTDLSSGSGTSVLTVDTGTVASITSSDHILDGPDRNVTLVVAGEGMLVLTRQ